MKILLVNNHTRHLEFLNKALAGHDMEVVVYQPGVDFNDSDKDLIILSGGGGEGLEINDTHHGRLWYSDEMEFILRTDKPILGICMGFEVISRAYGSAVTEMKELIQGFRKVTPTRSGLQRFQRDNLRQYEAHQWQVEDIDTKQFEVLAESSTGLEIIRHRRRPIIATQFHPEKGGTLKVQTLLNHL